MGPNLIHENTRLCTTITQTSAQRVSLFNEPKPRSTAVNARDVLDFSRARFLTCKSGGFQGD